VYALRENAGVNEFVVLQVNEEHVAVEYPADGVHVGVTVVLYVHVATPDDVPPVAAFQVTPYVLGVNVGVNEFVNPQVNAAQVAVEYPVPGVHVGVTDAPYVQLATPEDVPPVLAFQVTA
jgi:thiamine monophosphate synthase